MSVVALEVEIGAGSSLRYEMGVRRTGWKPVPRERAERVRVFRIS